MDFCGLYLPSCVLHLRFFLPTCDFLLKWKYSSFQSIRRPRSTVGRPKVNSLSHFLSIGKLQQLPPFLQRLPGRPARRHWSWALLLSGMGILEKGVNWSLRTPLFHVFVLLLPSHQYIRTQNGFNILAYFRQEKLVKSWPVSSVSCFVLMGTQCFSGCADCTSLRGVQI